MELINDELVFDDRNQDDLYTGINQVNPGYADILKRWVTGKRISDNEQRIAASILIFYPVYVLKNHKTDNFIELMLQSLEQPNLQNPDNIEKGLFLYTLFYFLLKTGAQKDALEVLCDLDNVFEHYNNTGMQVLEDGALTSDAYDHVTSGKHPSIKRSMVQRAYFEIITTLIDSNELLHLGPDFNLSWLPLPKKAPRPARCRNARGDALFLYEKKSYMEALNIYKGLLTERFEVPGTLIHMARIELTTGNIAQAETDTEMAWRHRNDAPHYVLARILWFRLCLLMLETGDKKEMLTSIHQIMTLLQNRDAIMEWSMQQLLEQLRTRLQENDHNLLTALVETMSNGENITKLDSLTDYLI